MFTFKRGFFFPGPNLPAKFCRLHPAIFSHNPTERRRKLNESCMFLDAVYFLCRLVLCAGVKTQMVRSYAAKVNHDITAAEVMNSSQFGSGAEPPSRATRDIGSDAGREHFCFLPF